MDISGPKLEIIKLCYEQDGEIIDKEIFEAISLPENKVKDIIEELRLDGFISYCERGFDVVSYEITDAGRRLYRNFRK